MGVVVGFLLGEGNRVIRDKLRIWRLLKMIRGELKAMKAQIEDKQDIIRQALDALSRRQMLGTSSVPMMQVVYRRHINDLYEHLSPLQRNCLHVVYERLADADMFLQSFEGQFLKAVETKVIDDPFDAYKKRFIDCAKNYRVTTDLIQSYLDGQPTDVLHMESRSDKSGYQH